MESADFISRLEQLPAKVKEQKIIKLGTKILIKTGVIVNFMNVTYKYMPEALRTARKKSMASSFRSFKHLEALDKLFFGKSALNKLGFSFVNLKDLNDLISTICSILPDDENKIKAILANQ